MTRKEKIILMATLLIAVLMAIMPPVTITSYDSSGGITRVSPVINYKFLFTSSWKQINYERLFFQYLIILIVSRWLIVSQKKVAASLSARVAELSITNDKLLQVINKGKNAGEQLRQKAIEIAAAKENLSRQINALKNEEKTWHTHRDELKQHMNERAVELSRANEQLEKQTAERKELEERFERQSNELKEIGERLQYQTRKLEEAEDCFKKQAAELADAKSVERQLREYNQQLEQRIEQRTAELSAGNRQLDKQLNEDCTAAEFSEEALRESDEQVEKREIPTELFDAKEMKALAELAKRLARR